MKNYLIISFIFIYCQSCVKQNNESKSLNDFEVKIYENYMFSNNNFKSFVENYIDLPENKERKIFTLYFDQRMDTLLFTIWRHPQRTIDLNNTFGYFYCKGKMVLICSPFFKLFETRIDTSDANKISALYRKEVEYYKTHKQELVMWQLQIPYHEDTFFIQKNFNRIINTVKPPVLDSVKVNVNYSAD
jgi:hypothetical protein